MLQTTYMDIIDELDQCRIALAEHDLDTKDVSETAE